ncbi:MAG: MFS transporter, partial [Rectinemataceae bacterium]|nr:MFS transporter [Rectinemataceae bacterium]
PRTMNRNLRPLLVRMIAPYRGLGGSLWSMFFATMINRFGDFIGAFLALYLSRILGFDAIRTGTTISLVFAVSMAGSLLSGRFADRLGRKRTLLLCQSAAGLINFSLSFLYGYSWAPWLIVFGSLFRGGARPLIGAILTDLSPAGRRKEVFGLQYWSINVGVAIGPIVAAFLFDRSIPWLFRGDALTTCVSVLLVARGVHVPAVAHATTSLEKHDERGALAAFTARPILVAFAGLALLNSITYSQTGFGLPMKISEALGAGGPGFMGFVMSLNAVTVIVLSIPIARLLRTKSPLSCMALSGGFYVIGFGMLAFPLGRAGLAASTFIWTVGEIVSSINMGVFVAKHSPANWRASFQSFMGVFHSAGWTISPLIAGPVLKGGGHSILWTVTAAICLFWAAGAFFVDRWDRNIVAVEISEGV